jgi:hypothetical protein
MPVTLSIIAFSLAGKLNNHLIPIEIKRDKLTQMFDSVVLHAPEDRLELLGYQGLRRGAVRAEVSSVSG